MSAQQAKPPPAPADTHPATAAPLTVESIMITEVHMLNADMNLREATQLLLKHQIAGAPVTDREKRVISVVSEGDLLKLAASVGLEKTVFQCLLKLTKTEKLITLKKTDTFSDAYRKFLSHSVHCLIVVDEKGKLEGMVTRSAVLKILADAEHATPKKG